MNLRKAHFYSKYNFAQKGKLGTVLTGYIIFQGLLRLIPTFENARFSSRNFAHWRHTRIFVTNSHSCVSLRYVPGTTGYQSIDDPPFQAHPLRSSKFSITLGKPAPPLNQHEEKPWYKANLSRAQVRHFYMYRTAGIQSTVSTVVLIWTV